MQPLYKNVSLYLTFNRTRNLLAVLLGREHVFAPRTKSGDLAEDPGLVSE